MYVCGNVTILQLTYRIQHYCKPHTDPLTWTYPHWGPLAHPAHTGALGGVGVNVSKVAEVEEGAAAGLSWLSCLKI